MDLRDGKFCNKCGTIKKLEDFAKKKDGLYGVAAVCKDCVNKHSKNLRKTSLGDSIRTAERYKYRKRNK